MSDEVLGELTLASLLLGVAGFVDAVGFLTAGQVFVSFASGNSTRFAIGVGGVALSKWYVAGGLGRPVRRRRRGGRILAIAAKNWRRPVILIAEAALLGVAALVPLSGVRPAFLMALAMGARTVIHKAGRTATRAHLCHRHAGQYRRAAGGRRLQGGPQLGLGFPTSPSGPASSAAAPRARPAYGAWGLRALLVPTAVVILLAAATGAIEWRRRRRSP